jgi:hypothetical protein
MNTGQKKKAHKTRIGKKPEGGTPEDSKANSEVYDLIGDRLRMYFDEVARQPVPERFVDLLSQLEKGNSPPKRK